MSLSPDYLSARFTGSRRMVAGFTLRPFCIDSLEQLELIGSPCILHDRVVSLSDIRVAARICSAPVGQGYRRVYGFCGWLFWRLTRRLYNADQECRHWQKYLEHNYITPVVWRTPAKDTKEISSPWTLALEIKLVKAGYPVEKVRTMPMGLAVWIGTALSESEGGARPMSDQETAILATMKAEAEKKGAGENV